MIMLVERVFPLGAAEIEVYFDWETSGGPGVGPGWGEETCARVRVGPLITVFMFIPDDDKPVGDWVVEEIQVLHEYEHDHAAIHAKAREAVRRAAGYGYHDPVMLHAAEEERLLARPKPFHCLMTARDAFLLSQAPEVCIAVQRGWEEVLFRQRMDSVAEDGWGAEGYISELEFQLNEEYGGPLAPEKRAEIVATLAEQRKRRAALKAEHNRLQAEFTEKFGGAETAL